MKKLLALLMAAILTTGVLNVGAEVANGVPQEEQDTSQPSTDYVYEDFNSGTAGEKQYYCARPTNPITKTYTSNFYSEKGVAYELDAANYGNNDMNMAAAYPYGWTTGNYAVNSTKKTGRIAWLGDDEDGYFGYNGKKLDAANDMWDILGVTNTGDNQGYYTLHQYLKPDISPDRDDTIVISFDYQTSKTDWVGTLPSWYDGKDVLAVGHPFVAQISNVYTTTTGKVQSGNWNGSYFLRTPYIYTKDGKVIAEFCAGNGIDTPFPKETDTVSLGVFDGNWATASKTGLITVTLSNVAPGDWITVQTVIKRKPNYEYEIRYYVNGELLVGTKSNEKIKAEWLYTPANVKCGVLDYDFKHGLGTTYSAVNEYRGLGLVFRGFTYDDETWQGIDNINMRYYGTTALPKVASCDSDTIEIPFENSHYKGSDAPAPVKAGVADLSEAVVKAYMYDGSDVYMINGTEVEGIEINNDKTQRTATMPNGETNVMDVNSDGTKLKLTGIPAIESGKKLVITLEDAKDILGKDLSNSTVTLYSGDGSEVGLLSYEMNDVFGKELLPNKDGVVSSTLKTLDFTVAEDNAEIGLYKLGETQQLVAGAVFENGTYKIDMGYDNLLEPNTEYALVHGSENLMTFKTDGTDLAYGPISITEDGAASVRYANMGSKDKEISFVGTAFNEYGEGVQTIREKKNLKAHTSDVLTLSPLVEADTRKAYIWEDTEYKDAEVSEEAVSIPKYFNENNKSVISGKTTADSDLKIAVYDANGNMCYANEIKADSEGKYSADIDFSGYATGEYTVVVYDNGKTYKSFKSFSADSTTGLETLNKAATVDEMLKAVGDFRNELELDYSVYDKLANKKYAAEKLLEYKTKNGDFAKKADLVKVFRQYSVMQAFAEKNIISDIEKVMKDITEIQSGNLQKWYYNTERAITPARMTGWLTDITKNMNTSSEMSDFDEFRKELTCSAVFAVIKNPGNKDNIYNILNDFSSEIVSGSSKLDMSDLTDAVLSKLYGTTLTGFDYATLLKAIEQYKNGSGTSSVISGGGSGGSGGGSKISSVSIGGGIASVVNPQPIENEAAYAFADMKAAAWANDAVTMLVKNNIVSGDENGNFNPEAYVTRAEFVKMIVEAVKKDAEDKEMNFTDVTDDDWFKLYVLNAYARNLINGMPDGTFGSNLNISRQDMAVIINNILEEQAKVPEMKNETEFADNAEISEYAQEAVKNVLSAAVVNGYEDGSFKPNNNATRAEAATVIYKLLEYLKK